MKKLMIILLLFSAFSVFADTSQAPVSNTPATTPQSNAQASTNPDNESTQQINQYFDKAKYKFFKKNQFKPLFQVENHD